MEASTTAWAPSLWDALPVATRAPRCDTLRRRKARSSRQRRVGAAARPVIPRAQDRPSEETAEPKRRIVHPNARTTPTVRSPRAFPTGTPREPAWTMQGPLLARQFPEAGRAPMLWAAFCRTSGAPRSVHRTGDAATVSLDTPTGVAAVHAEQANLPHTQPNPWRTYLDPAGIVPETPAVQARRRAYIEATRREARARDLAGTFQSAYLQVPRTVRRFVLLDTTFTARVVRRWAPAGDGRGLAGLARSAHASTRREQDAANAARQDERNPDRDRTAGRTREADRIRKNTERVMRDERAPEGSAVRVIALAAVASGVSAAKAVKAAIVAVRAAEEVAAA